MASNIDHGSRGHAVLSASGAARWLACTPSALLEKDVYDPASPAALEGTAAHELSEIFLANRYERLSDFETDTALKEFRQSNEFYTKAMEQQVKKYVDFVEEQYNTIKAESNGIDPIILIEQRLDFSHIVPGGYGTGDVTIVGPETIHVIDLKFGRGPVFADDNPQLRLYAAGAVRAYSMFYPFRNVRMSIYQPRAHGESTAEMTVEDLNSWATEYVAPRAALAAKGEGERVAGEHCFFCKVKDSCPAIAAEAVKDYEQFVEKERKLKEEMTPEQLAEIVQKAKYIKNWLTSIENYAKEQAEAGVKLPGLKLIAGTRRRSYKDENEVIESLKGNGVDLEEVTTRKLLPLTKLESALGDKFDEIVAKHVEQKQGAPRLVAESDPRPEFINPFQNVQR